ncbi:hypothetical protein FACS18949_13090 [Clostridia bacterium]|nr:hypothetical protein FACS18949_13090 [Clostridia bacterium]
MPRKKKIEEPETIIVPEITEESIVPIESETPKPQPFYALDFHELDKNLSPDEHREWNAIYASYRAGSILTGTVAGVDSINLGGKSVECLVLFNYRVKVLIPRNEVWADDGTAQSDYILRRFLGAEVDYIVREVDRVGGVAVASRKLALNHRRKSFAKHLPEVGELMDCRVLAVASTRLLLECGGFEITLSQRQISYGTILDLREDYKPGQSIKAVFKGLQDGKISLSVKEVNPHPFDNAESRHPLGCRRVSRIVGKYAGGVFCELERGFTCLCLYSPEQRDSDFDLGDSVIIVVTRFDRDNKLVYGRIVSRW